MPEELVARGGAAVGRDGSGVRLEGAMRAVVPRRRGAVRVCIVYEHSLFAHGIKRLLEQQKALRMIGLVERATVSARDLRRLKPDVVELLTRGAVNKEIAAALHISENTVKNHMKSIMEKLHAENRVQVVAYALRRGLVKRSPPS